MQRPPCSFWEGRRDEVVRSWKADAIEFYRKFDLLDIVTLPQATWDAGVAGRRPNAPQRVDENTWRYPDGRTLRYSDISADITLT